jgi:hypothetical protein
MGVGGLMALKFDDDYCNINCIYGKGTRLVKSLKGIHKNE